MIYIIKNTLLSYFSPCCDESILRKEGLRFGSLFEGTVPHSGEGVANKSNPAVVARAELARLCVSVRKEREGIAQTLFSFSDFLFLRCGTPASEMVLSTFKKGLSCSAKTPRKCPRSHTKDVIKGIQSPVKLTVKIRHRSSYIALFCSLVTPGPSDGLPHV